ncbi:MAG TPA: low molecular weight protein tyrosine phosphatase family protein [Vitreimonas sp.]|nr:low molecular weight protein tyrosine phosphatase family protein [Vitreimonas sp.]
MNVLFLCTQNRMRSPTAEQVFASWPGIETDSAGLHSSAHVVLSPEQIEWADLIVVMEARHRAMLSKDYGSHPKNKRIICADVPDKYPFMDPALVALLKAKVGPHLK